MASSFDAVIPAGGTARRLDGMDKAMLVVAGTTLLERVLTAVVRARTVVVVGPERPVAGSIVGSIAGSISWAREDPPLSGPLAALATGLRHGTAEHVVVAACDLPHFTGSTVDALLTALDAAPYADGAVLVDATGRRQPLAAVYRRPALTTALTAIGDPRDRPVRLLTDALTLVEVPDALAAVDIDTPEDLTNLHTQTNQTDQSSDGR